MAEGSSKNAGMRTRVLARLDVVFLMRRLPGNSSWFFDAPSPRSWTDWSNLFRFPILHFDPSVTLPHRFTFRPLGTCSLLFMTFVTS